MRNTKLKKPESSVEIFDDFMQGDDQWRKIRAGIPTASRFADLMAGGDGKMRASYMRELAGELISGKPAETYSNKHMERGQQWEAEARDAYELVRGVEVRQVAFVRNGMKGASPDGLVGDDGGVEIKTMAPHLMIELLERGTPPTTHDWQRHGNIWVCDRRWWDLFIYSPNFPPFLHRMMRDEQKIARLEIGVSSFNDQVAELVARIRAYGQRQRAGDR